MFGGSSVIIADRVPLGWPAQFHIVAHTIPFGLALSISMLAQGYVANDPLVKRNISMSSFWYWYLLNYKSYSSAYIR